MPKNRGSHNFVSIVDQTHFSQLILGEKPKPIASEPRMAHKKNNEKSNAAPPKKNVWFVEFYANFAETCVYTRSLWAEYSRKYDCDELHFADVNLEKNKPLAEKYYINTSGVSRQ